MDMYNRTLRAWRKPSGHASAMSDDAPKVAIIVPTRNRKDLLAQTIQSVFAQTYDNWEMLVVDDASDDGTPKLVEDLARHEPRLRLIQLAPPRTGAPAARNTGVALSSAPLVIFLDSDDLLAP